MATPARTATGAVIASGTGKCPWPVWSATVWAKEAPPTMTATVASNPFEPGLVRAFSRARANRSRIIPPG